MAGLAAQTDEQANVAERNSVHASQYYSALAALARSLPARQQSLKNMAAEARAQYDAATAGLRGAQPLARAGILRKRLDVIDQLLSFPDNDMSFGLSDNVPREVAEAVAATARASIAAAKFLRQFAAAPCDIDTMDDAVDDVDATFAAAAFVAARAADLKTRADACSPPTPASDDKGAPVDAPVVAGVEELPEDKTPKNKVKDPNQPTKTRLLGEVLGAVAKAIEDVKRTGGARQPAEGGPAPAPSGDLTGAWEMMSISNLSGKDPCTVSLLVTLQPAGNNAWQGGESWRHNCQDPPRAAANNFWRLSLTGPGILGGTVTRGDGTVVPLKGTFDGSRITLGSGNDSLVWVRR